MTKSGRYELVPNPTSVKREMERISTRSQLTQRLHELERINKNVKADSYDEVELGGRIVPKYLADEIEYSKRVVNDDRRRARQANYPSWDEMDVRERAAHQSDGNIGDLRGSYTSPDDLDDLTDMHYAESDANYMRKYISTWHEYCVVRSYEDDVVNNIEWLMENRPGAIREILDRGYIQAKIDYIYEDSADLNDLRVRHNNIVEFWQDMRAKYE